ncbi:MAG: SipW-dependent-type signal peptide-containing protein [Anaerolineaceae bacterium]|nr:SipW-dependent-type signal peptide-containing protein [Anaerolineaceae bacterium]
MYKKAYFSFIAVVIILAMVAAGTFAYFSNTKTLALNTTTAKVQVGDTTGFPLEFNNLLPGILSSWKETTVKNASTVPVDLYFGLKAVGGNCDLIHPDVLHVVIQLWNGSDWVNVYNSDGISLFAAWQKISEDMPEGQTYTFRAAAQLASTAGNEYQNCWINNQVFLHAVQYNGTAPSTAPYAYNP